MEDKRIERNIVNLKNSFEDHISRGDSINVWGLPLAGTSTSLRSFSAKKDILIIYLDSQSLTDQSSESFYELLSSELMLHVKDIDKDSLPAKPFLKVRQLIHKITENNQKVCIIVDTLRDLTFLDESFLSTFRALRDRFLGKLCFIFVSDRPLHEDPHYKEFPNFIDFACHIEYVSQPSEEGDTDIIKDLALSYSDELAKEENLKKLLELSGGIFGLITSSLRYLSSEGEIDFSPKSLLEGTVLRQRVQYIVQSFTQDEIETLAEIARKKAPDKSKISNYISKSGILTPKGEIRSKLIEYYLLNIYSKEKKSKTPEKPADKGEDTAVNDQKLRIDAASGEIYINGKRHSQILSETELKIIDYMKKNDQNVTTRDEIAKLIWGNAYLENYSDWAIDKTISRIRKKIKDSAKPHKHLVTIKGKGFKLHIS
ncbi:winged helix-turn-helix transcriptional regulator [Candidatus Dojkabacteria bacterium]|nr:winged helix-turn-helix transcriptional regulator [Candidatus Dojkabacteria bacterium]